jgi:hypothetical protein
MTEEEQKLYDGWVQQFIDSGFTDDEARAQADSKLATYRANQQGDQQDKAYQWLTQFPPGFKPGPRRQYVGDRVQRMTGQPAFAVLPSDALIDANGNVVRNPDGTIKKMYGPDDVQGILRGMPYTMRRQVATVMKNLGVYGNSAPSANVDQLVDFNAFARVLYTSNQEGVSWDSALDIIATRLQELPQSGRTKVYKSTSIADLKRSIQDQASQLLGRGLTKEELMPLAQRIQKQEIATARRADQPGATEEAPQTSTLVEQGIKKDFQTEMDTQRFAAFMGSVFGGGRG